MPKKEALLLGHELAKLERYLIGVRDLDRVPEAVFILDTKKENIAVTEARKLGLPIVAVVDTNCDPDIIQYVIPGNDDAIRSGRLMCRIIADAVADGQRIRSNRAPKNAGPATSVAPAARFAPPRKSGNTLPSKVQLDRSGRRSGGIARGTADRRQDPGNEPGSDAVEAAEESVVAVGKNRRSGGPAGESRHRHGRRRRGTGE